MKFTCEPLVVPTSDTRKPHKIIEDGMQTVEEGPSWRPAEDLASCQVPCSPQIAYEMILVGACIFMVPFGCPSEWTGTLLVINKWPNGTNLSTYARFSFSVCMRLWKAASSASSLCFRRSQKSKQLGSTKCGPSKHVAPPGLCFGQIWRNLKRGMPWCSLTHTAKAIESHLH